METYCLKCKKDTKTQIQKFRVLVKSMILSKCAICGSKILRFIKNQETKCLLSNLSIITPLNKVPILGDTLF